MEAIYQIRRYALRFVYIRHSLSTFPPFSAPPAPTFLNFYFHLFWELENRFLSCYPLIGILLCPPCRLSERSNHADTTLAAGLPLLDHCKTCWPFALMGLDKRRARRGCWRISEKALFFFPVLGGSLGGCWGCTFCHHKTRHWYFRAGFPLLFLFQAFLLFFLWRWLAP